MKPQRSQTLCNILGFTQNVRDHPLTSVKEHVTNNRRAPVDFERVAAHYNPLQDNTPRVTAKQTACSHKVLDA